MTAFTFGMSIDQRDLDRYMAKLDKLHGLPYLQRIARSYQAVGALLVKPMRSAAPLERSRLDQASRHKPGNLRAKIKAKALHPRSTEVAAVWIGSTSPAQHLVVRGTRAHPLANVRAGKSQFAVFGIDQVRRLAGLQHPGARANPYVDAVAERYTDDVLHLVGHDVFELI